MNLHLEILPLAQKKLWMLLADIPKNFILYGGTAIALKLGHRISIDFDFFSTEPLNKDLLIEQFSLLSKFPLVHPEINTLDCIIEFPEGSVKIQFLCGLEKRQRRIDPVLIASDNQLQLASLNDLFGTKLNTIQRRAECKDYIDIDAMINSGISLEQGLGYASAIYGSKFDPASSLRALCSYRDGDLPELDKKIQQRLCKVARKVEKIPVIKL